MALPTLIGISLLITPVLWIYSNSKLATLAEETDWRLDFGSLSVDLTDGHVVYRNVTVAARSSQIELLSVPLVKVQMPVHRAWQGGAIDEISLFGPTLYLEHDVNEEVAAQQAHTLFAQILAHLPWSSVKKVTVYGGSVVTVDSVSRKQRTLAHHLTVTLEELSLHGNPRAPARVMLRGELFDGGMLHAKFSLQPLGDEPEASGRLNVDRLAATSVCGFWGLCRTEARGTIDVQADFTATGPRLVAAVQAFVQGLPPGRLPPCELDALEAATVRLTGVSAGRTSYFETASPGGMASVRLARILSGIALHGALLAMTPPPPSLIASENAADWQLWWMRQHAAAELAAAARGTLFPAGSPGKTPWNGAGVNAIQVPPSGQAEGNGPIPKGMLDTPAGDEHDASPQLTIP